MPKPVVPLWERVYPRKGRHSQHNTPILPGDPGPPWQHRSKKPGPQGRHN